jgi:hypothetical protein
MGRRWSTIAHPQIQKTERETPTSSGVGPVTSSLHRHTILAVYFLPAGFLGTQQVSSLEGFTTGTGTGTGAESASTQKMPPIVDLLGRDSTSNFLRGGGKKCESRVRIGDPDRMVQSWEIEHSVLVLLVSYFNVLRYERRRDYFKVR